LTTWLTEADVAVVHREVIEAATVAVVVTVAEDVVAAVDVEVRRATRRSGSPLPSLVVW
jgi:hypothetical protein